MFITGAPGFGTNHIYHTALVSSGNFVSAPADLGVTSGSSGPVVFDSAGNLFYAPGYYDKKIYKWSAAEVASAIADPTANPLPAASGKVWWDYSIDFSGVSGATGMAIDANGNLVMTLTDFINPSYLVEVNVSGGAYGGNYTSILSSTDRLGDVAFHNGSLYVANANQILQVVPEPSACLLLLLSAAGAAALRRRKK
jgi:hypothetical protein